MSTGIHVTRNSLSFTTSIGKNYIHCQWPDATIYGIRALFNEQTINLDISKNEIDLYADPVEGPNIGIELEEFNQMPNTTTVKSNKIHMRGNTYGIHARNTNATLISNNESIIYDFNSVKRGININRCIRQRIIENYCHGLTNNYGNAGTVFSYGIYTNESTRGVYVCNTTEKLRRGIYFQNFCDQTDFRTNIMGRSSRGLSLFNAIIGDQIDKGNRWPAGPTGYSGGIGANNNANPIMEIFYTPNTSFTYTPNPSPSNWFINSTNHPPICHPNEPLPDLTYDDDPTPGDTTIVEDQREYEYEAEEWQDKMTVYEKGLDNPSFINSGFLIQQFFAAYENTSVGLNTTLKKQLHDFAVSCSSEVDNFSQLITQSDNLYEALWYRDSLLYAGGLTNAQLEVINQEKDSLIAEIKALNSGLESAQAALQACIMPELSGLQTDVIGLPDNTIYESNLKLATQIYLDWLSAGQINSASQQSLYFIATQCRLEGGPGVELARGLIRTLDAATEFNDEQTCGSNSRIKSEADDEIFLTQSALPFKLVLLNDDLLQILPMEENFLPEHFQIADITGRIIKSGVISGHDDLFITLKELAKGCYIIKVKTIIPSALYSQKFLK